MVKDKINYRARGPNTMLTKQPVQGRANDGGLRIGEMERDGVLAHGMSYFLNESFMIRADEYFMAVCNKTGSIAIYNEAKNLFLSPYADGPIKFANNPDGTQNIKNLSKFGRSFSIIRVPYSLKLLIQELQVMNVQMRIITDENVDQLLSMSYSDNINKLLQVGNKDLKDVTRDYAKNMSDRIYKENKIGDKQQKPADPNSLPEPVTIEEGDNVSLSSVNEEYKYGQNVEVNDLATGEFKEAHIVKVNDFDGVGERTYDVRYETSELEQYVPASRIRIYSGPQYDPNSPPYNPSSPPQYTPNSPLQYTPPQYTPNSPPYNPSSPPQQQQTPPIQIQINTAPQTTESPSILEVAPPPKEETKEEEKNTESSETKTITINENNSDNSSSSSDTTKKITL